MPTLKIKTHVEPDGHLRLDVPTTLPGGEVDLTLVIEPRPGGRGYDFGDLLGALTWRGDAVAVQRQLRDEWPA